MNTTIYRNMTLSELEREAYNYQNLLAIEILKRLSDDFDNELHLTRPPKTKYKEDIDIDAKTFYPRESYKDIK